MHHINSEVDYWWTLRFLLLMLYQLRVAVIAITVGNEYEDQIPQVKIWVGIPSGMQKEIDPLVQTWVYCRNTITIHY